MDVTRKTSSKSRLDFDLKIYLEQRRKAIDTALDYWLPPSDRFPVRLHSAMRHSLFSGGKRLRSILVLAAAEACGGRSAMVMPAACALECIHTYSLIHDDLPAMDNDDLRRGEPTCHKVYGEAAAILAGDALLTLAFELMTKVKLPTKAKKTECLSESIAILARAAGQAGMVGGQMADLEAESQAIEIPMLQYIHTHKTGCLIQAALLVGARLSGASRTQRQALSVYGETLGLAFQITDDILNITGEMKLLGKKTGTDVNRGKATYPALYGIEESRIQARRLIERGRRALRIFGQSAEPLSALGKFIIEREA